MTSRPFGLLVFLFVVAWPGRCAAQISPPGLGSAKTASWTALGLRQDLDTAQRRQSVTYVGIGTVSDPNEPNPFRKPAILVLNEELYAQFHATWLGSLALSYRRQNLYAPDAPFAPADPPTKQELRIYARWSHVLKANRLRLTNTLRPEVRNFFGAGLGPEQERLELRFRFKTQLALMMDAGGEHRLVASAEALASVARARSGDWDGFGYRESRFCLYYSLNLKRMPIVFDIGYMNNLLGAQAPLIDVHYLAIDVIWLNPFGTPKSAARH